MEKGVKLPFVCKTCGGKCCYVAGYGQAGYECDHEQSAVIAAYHLGIEPRDNANGYCCMWSDDGCLLPRDHMPDTCVRFTCKALRAFLDARLTEEMCAGHLLDVAVGRSADRITCSMDCVHRDDCPVQIVKMFV